MSKFKLTPPEPTESQLHRTVAELLDWLLVPPAMYTTFPAGWGVLTRATAGRLKGAGLKRGMPDILVFYSGRTIGIELKSYKGLVTRAQSDMFLQLHAAGVPVYVCTNVDQIISILKTEEIPLRRCRGASDGAQEADQITESSSAAQPA